MKTGRREVIAAVAAGALLLLGPRPAPAHPASSPISGEQIARIVASPDRSEADRKTTCAGGRS